jgi:hypothetical protein
MDQHSPDMPDPRDINWREPWHPLEAARRRALESQLQKELSPHHRLFGRTAVALGCRCDNDDVLFLIAGERTTLAVVHLTWRGSPDPYPDWPWTVFFDGVQDWTRRCLQLDHEQWIVDSQ